MTKYARIVLCLLLALALVFCLAACTDDGEPKQTEPSGGTKDPEMFQIETSRGTLQFPKQWQADLNIQKRSDESGEEILFQETVSKSRLTLFTVRIGASEKGSYIGSLTDQNGSVSDVYLIIEELQPDPDLTEDARSQIYAMQESVNYLIEGLK